jgi:hypothetical protein
MKSHPPLIRLLVLFVSLAALLPGSIRAQEPSAPDSDIQLTQPQLDQLLGPIALYPDALVALILPASTVPTDIVLAARYLNAAGSAAEIDGQGWNDSVKALARYPEVIKWMDENLTWTQQMGTAFLAQQTDVMTAIQRLRTRARATGALANTPQQQVVEDEGSIEIVPTQPNVIYVPRYDPDIVYVADPDYYYNGPLLTFGYGFPTGYWLSYEFDWRRRSIWVGDRHHDWYRPGSPGRPNYPNNPNWHPWKPPVNRPLPPPHGIHRPRPEVVRPRPFPGTPPSPRNWRRDDSNRPTRPDTSVRPSASNQSQAASATGSNRNPSGWNPGSAPQTSAVTSSNPSRTPTQPAAPSNRTPQVKTVPGPRIAVPPSSSSGSSTPAAAPVPATPPAPTSRDNAPR